MLYQRPDGSAHVINAVHTDSKDPAGHDVVVLWDPQKGEEAGKADVSAVTGMWVIPVPEAEPEPDQGMVVLPRSGFGLRSQGWGSGLPTEVAGPKRQPGESGPEAGKTGAGAKRTRGETYEGSRGKAGESLRGVKRRKVTAAAAGIDPGSPGNGESGVLTPNDQATQQEERMAERKQQGRAKSAKYRQGLRAAAGRVVVLEELAGRGQLAEEQAAELAELQPKVAQRKQQKKEKNVKEYQARKAAADRVVVLEELVGRGELTEEQEAELAALQPKVAQWKQQKKADNAKYYQARRAAADRVAELEKLKERGPLTEEQAAELAALQPKTAQRKQQEKANSATQYQARKAAAARVVVLEELEGRGELTEEQEAELAALRPKVEQRRQQKKANNAKRYQARRAAADRVAELEKLKERGPLTEEQEAELAELRSTEAQRGRKKKDRGVMETGVGEAPVAGQDERIAGPEGVSEWAGTDQDGRDAWSADFDLGEWLELSVTGSAVSGDAGAGGAGVMLGEGAVEDVVATELPAFLGRDAGADDFAGFLPDYHDWDGSVGLFGVEGPGEGAFGDPFPEDAVWADGGWPDAVGGVGESGAWADSDRDGGGAVGSGFRFVRGVNQASYFLGDARFRVNCLEACVAFHNSLKFGRQFVAGPAGADRDPVRLEVAFGRQAQRVEGVAGAEWYVRGGPVGVAVPVLYQRPDGSAHVINAVHTDSKDPAGRDVVVFWDPQKGEEAEKADVSAVTGMWVIPVPEAEPDQEMVVLPSSGSGLRSQGWGSGLPTEVMGPKRQPDVSGPEAGKPGAGAKRTRAETGESSWGAKRRKVTAAAAGIDPGSPGNDESGVLTPTDQATEQDELTAERRRKDREKAVKYRRARKAAADRFAELEKLNERGQLTSEQAGELAALQPKAAEWKQQKKAKNAKEYQARRAAADRVVVLEELAGRGQLTEELEAELVELRPKVTEWKQKKRKRDTTEYQAITAAADRVVVLEELAGRGQLTEELEAELAELRPKAERKMQKTERDAKARWRRRAEAVRVAELEELEGWGPLTEEQAAELAALRLKVAGRRRKNKDRDVMDTGASGAPLAGRDERIAGPEGASEWADFDLGAWLDQAVADSAVSRDTGATDAGAALGEGTYEEFVANELTAYLGQDAGDDADAGGARAVANGDDFAGFLPDYHDGAGSVGLFGVEGPDGISAGDRDG
ncbi:hypothetical protein [Saccharopolyspora spinosa]|uniref:hypothetical protein n=1 Tax=Saccharopolyspora spinosa TaxID=60894 RepID=UPI001EED0A9D|nr:hypothetical protein [Saccharopolyspora spinosa]